jgi:hypothetical protein
MGHNGTRLKDVFNLNNDTMTTEQNEIKSAEWRKKNLSKNSSLANIVCSCYLCGKSIEQPEEQYDMYGEMVCQDCWNYNMYQALQDGGGM